VPAKANTVRFANWAGSTNNVALTSAATVASGTWHHVAVVYDRTNSLVGNFTLYLDERWPARIAVVMGVSQSYPVVLGGHANPEAVVDRWFDGRLDDLAVFKTPIRGASCVAHNRTVAHFGGLSTSVTVSSPCSPTSRSSRHSATA